MDNLCVLSMLQLKKNSTFDSDFINNEQQSTIVTLLWNFRLSLQSILWWSEAAEDWCINYICRLYDWCLWILEFLPRFYAKFSKYSGASFHKDPCWVKSQQNLCVFIGDDKKEWSTRENCHDRGEEEEKSEGPTASEKKEKYKKWWHGRRGDHFCKKYSERKRGRYKEYRQRMNVKMVVTKSLKEFHSFIETGNNTSISIFFKSFLSSKGCECRYTNFILK